MLVHLEDKGELNVIIGDDGEYCFICSKCGKIWCGRLNPVDQRGIKSGDAPHLLQFALQSTPSFFKKNK